MDVPTVKVDWLEGRSLEQRRELARKITDVVSEVANVPPEAVHVFIAEYGRDEVAEGGILYSDK